MELIFSSISEVFSPITFILLTLGVIIGTIFGAIPGLTATMGVALFVPITFSLDPVSGLLLLIGIYLGGVSGGLIAATLLGIPGTPSSIATTFDAYPMARNGEPVRALGIGIVASLVGGLISFIALITISPIISRYAVKMGPFEYFSLTLFALSLIAVLAKGGMLKGLTSGIIGMAIALIGFAPLDGTERYTFNILELKAGIDLLPLIMGLFAISQILLEIQQGENKKEMNFTVKGLGLSIKEFFANTWNMIRSSLIGIGFGILPGLGSGASNLVAYAQAKQSSRNPKAFGKGSAEGIFAAESANNASVGGALIPMLTLGIPGDTVTAILLGGFMIHGIQPGPLLFNTNPDIVYVVFIGFFAAILLVFLFQMFAMRIFPMILKIPQNYLYPILLVMTVIGAYTTNNTVFNIWVMLFFGLIGIILIKNNFPIAPLILGFVLGPLSEMYLRRAIMYSGNALDLITRPISALFIIAAISCIVYTFVQEIRNTKTSKTSISN